MKTIASIVSLILLVLSAVGIRYSAIVALIFVVLKLTLFITISWSMIGMIFLGMLIGGFVSFFANALIIVYLND